MAANSKYIFLGAKEPIFAQLFDKSSNAPLVGKTDIHLQIRRHQDNLYLDWADSTFKVDTAVTQLQQQMTEIAPAYNPGTYSLRRTSAPPHVDGLDTSIITNANPGDVYDITVIQVGGSDAAGLPVGYELHIHDTNSTGLPAAVANAVWNAMQSDHTITGSFGDLMRRIVALQKEHYVIDNMSHNAQGLLLSARIRLFENKTDVTNATDGGSGEGEFATYTFSTTAGTIPALASLVKSTRDS